jgi:hypothetical protein
MIAIAMTPASGHAGIQVDLRQKNHLFQVLHPHHLHPAGPDFKHILHVLHLHLHLQQIGLEDRLKEYVTF